MADFMIIILIGISLKNKFIYSKYTHKVKEDHKFGVVKPNLWSLISFPLHRSGWFGGDVVDNAIDVLNLICNSV